MESKWYLFPGQTVENTKISDRAHALHITQKEWGKVTKHLDRKRLIQEALDKEKAHKRALKEGSEAMTKEWQNSIENLRIRKDKERKEDLDMKNEEKMRHYYEMRAEQEEERKKYVEKVKKEVFKSTGYPKELTSALILSETLYEREQQKEFNDMIRIHNENIKREFDEQLIKQSEDEYKKENDKKANKAEEARKYGQELKQQIEENEFTSKERRSMHVKREVEDRIQAEEEERYLHQAAYEEKMKKQQEIKESNKQNLEEVRKSKAAMLKEEKEMEHSTALYAEAKMRIDCKMKQRAKQLQEESVARRVEIAKKVAAIAESKEKEEEERIAKVLAEKAAEEKAKLEAKAKYDAQMTQERLDDRKKYIERREKEEHNKNEIEKWEMLNRIKTSEVMKAYNVENRKKKWEEVLQYRKELQEQQALDREVLEEERAENLKDYELTKQQIKDYNDQFVKYGDEVLELAKTKKRPTYPIEKVINVYKKTNNLLQNDRHCRCCTKHKKEA